MDFLFHKISEKEKEQIRKQAKKIIDDFSKQLSKVKKNVGDPLIERESGEREEGHCLVYLKALNVGAKSCGDFSREIMFENASEKAGDFILGERKKW